MNADSLTELPNIGSTLAKKLNLIGVRYEHELKEMGSENAFIKIATIDNSGTCINMLYALKSAIQGIRWHALNIERKQELKKFNSRIN